MRPCKYLMCPALTNTNNGYCEQHKKQYNASKKNNNFWASWYSSTRWRTARQSFLKSNPLCAECERKGKLTSATVVDHKIDHKGDLDKFWDVSNWQPLCKQCHDRKTMTTMRG